jgi:hypothetical protein
MTSMRPISWPCVAAIREDVDGELFLCRAEKALRYLGRIQEKVP